MTSRVSAGETSPPKKKPKSSVQPGSRISSRRKAAQAEGGPEYTAKRDELIRVAATLFRERGYKATTLNEIANHAGLDRATMYYYVGSKEELFRDAIAGVLDRNLHEAEALLWDAALNPKQKLRKLIDMLMGSYERSYPYMYVYIQEEMLEVSEEGSTWARQMVEQTHRFEKVVMTLISQGQADGLLRKDVTVGLAANAIFGMLNWTHRWYVPNRMISAQEIADAFSLVFFEGMQIGE